MPFERQLHLSHQAGRCAQGLPPAQNTNAESSTHALRMAMVLGLQDIACEHFSCAFAIKHRGMCVFIQHICWQN